MQGQYNHGDAYYRCRYPKEYALASHVRHPAMNRDPGACAWLVKQQVTARAPNSGAVQVRYPDTLALIIWIGCS